MAYITEDLANHFLNQSLVESGSMYIDAEPSFEEIANAVGQNNVPDLLHTVSVSSGVENPKWTRATYFINFRVRGRNKTFNQTVRERAILLYDELLGSSTIQVGTNLYSQINASETPRFSGYYEGSEPIYTFTLSIIRESTVDIGHRQTF